MELWDRGEDDLLRSEDGRWAASVWEARRRASGGEYDTWYEWAVWDAATGEELLSGGCSSTTGRWGNSGKSPDSYRFDGGDFVVAFDEGPDERVTVPAPTGKIAAGTQVVRMSFRGNRLGPELAAAMAGSPLLRRATAIDLRGNAIGDDGATAIARAHLPRLRELRILDGDVGVDGLAALRAKLGEQLIATPGEPRPDGARPFWTFDEHAAAIAELAIDLEDRKHTVATELSTAAPDAPKRLVVYRPGATLIPRDPATSYTIDAAIAGQGGVTTIEGLSLDCVTGLEGEATATLDALLDAMIDVRQRT